MLGNGGGPNRGVGGEIILVIGRKREERAKVAYRT